MLGHEEGIVPPGCLTVNGSLSDSVDISFVKGLGRTVAKDLRCVFWKLAHYCSHEATEIDMHEEGYGWARVGHCKGEWTSELSVLKQTVTFAFWRESGKLYPHPLGTNWLPLDLRFSWPVTATLLRRVYTAATAFKVSVTVAFTHFSTLP